MADVTVRDAGPDDYVVAAPLRAAASPDRIITPEGMRVGASGLPERAAYRCWIAEVGERAVGWGIAQREWMQPDDRIGFLDVVVDPEQQRRGLGARLLDLAEAHLAENGITTFRGSSVDAPGARALAEGRGYRAAFAASTSAVDPRTVQPLPLPPDVRLAAFGEIDDARPVYDLDMEVSGDVPGNDSIESMTLEDWTRRFWHQVFADDECSLVLYVDHQPAALTIIRVERSTGRANNNITGVRRQHRGRGLARILKSHALHRAARAGVTLATTDNDESNAPMLAVNRRLGYQHLVRRVEWERTPAPA